MTTADPKMIQEQAQGIANVAQAIADGTLTASAYGAVLKLEGMIEILKAWMPDDRPFAKRPALTDGEAELAKLLAKTDGEDPEEDLDEVKLMKDRHTPGCISAARQDFRENRRDYIASDGQAEADRWMPIAKRDQIVAEWLSDGTKTCECSR